MARIFGLTTQLLGIELVLRLFNRPPILISMGLFLSSLALLMVSVWYEQRLADVGSTRSSVRKD